MAAASVAEPGVVVFEVELVAVVSEAGSVVVVLVVEPAAAVSAADSDAVARQAVFAEVRPGVVPVGLLQAAAAYVPGQAVVAWVVDWVAGSHSAWVFHSFLEANVLHPLNLQPWLEKG